MFHHEIYADGEPTSFDRFVSYLLKQPQDLQFRNDIHWRPIHEICHPCQINYDFIGNYETLAEDLKEISRMLNIDIRLPMTRKKNEILWTNSFKNVLAVRPDAGKMLQEHYLIDFKMFNYTFVY